jgi:hypothetical protein
MMDGVRMTRPALTRDSMLGRSVGNLESKPGSIPVGATVEIERHGRVPVLPENLLFYFCQLIPRQLVGISVGIGSDRRRKLLQLQMVI